MAIWDRWFIVSKRQGKVQHEPELVNASSETKARQELRDRLGLKTTHGIEANPIHCEVEGCHALAGHQLSKEPRFKHIPWKQYTRPDMEFLGPPQSRERFICWRHHERLGQTLAERMRILEDRVEELEERLSRI